MCMYVNDGLSLMGVLTLPFSSRFVSMTMVADPCSHTMRQKSGTESGTGPEGFSSEVRTLGFYEQLRLVSN